MCSSYEQQPLVSLCVCVSVFQASGAPSLFESTEEEILPSVASAKTADEKKPVELVPSSDNNTEIKKKPAGAVSLFGGIDILGNKQDTSKVSKIVYK